MHGAVRPDMPRLPVDKVSQNPVQYRQTWLDRGTKPARVESGSDANRFLIVPKWYDTQHIVQGLRCDFIFIRLRLQQHPIMSSRSKPFPEKSFPLSSDDVTSPYLLLVTNDPDSRTRCSRCTLHILPPATTVHRGCHERHFPQGQDGLNILELCA